MSVNRSGSLVWWRSASQWVPWQALHHAHLEVRRCSSRKYNEVVSLASGGWDDDRVVSEPLGSSSEATAVGVVIRTQGGVANTELPEGVGVCQIENTPQNERDLVNLTRTANWLRLN